MSINLEKIILDSPIQMEICNYLKISDIKKISFLTKTIYLNKNNNNYSKSLIKEKSIKIIINFFRKYLNMIKNDKLNDKISLALYYFRYYEKDYIKSFYNINVDWKKIIINKYKTKFTDNPTRFDLYHLIKLIPVDETYAIGW